MAAARDVYAELPRRHFHGRLGETLPKPLYPLFLDAKPP